MFEETTGRNNDLHNAESNIIVINDINNYYCCLANKFAVHTSSGRLFYKRTTVTKTILEETTGHDDDLHNAESNIVVVFRTKN